MLAKEGRAVVTCNFCSESYEIESDELTHIRDYLALRGPRQRN
jgi:hypothetical protein